MAINRKLGRTTDIRKAMLKSLTTDLLVYGKVETTLARAKEVKSIADSLISLAIKEKDNLRLNRKMKIKSLFFNPLFLASYVKCLYLALKNKDLTWEKIEHTVNIEKETKK